MEWSTVKEIAGTITALAGVAKLAYECGTALFKKTNSSVDSESTHQIDRLLLKKT